MTAIQELKIARSAYKLAKIRFNEELNPELIDAAIYEMEAAQKRISIAWQRIKAEAMTRRGSR